VQINGILHDLLPADSYIWGTADLTGLVDKKFGNHRYAISTGKRLDDKIIDSITDGPTIEYYEHYRRTNRELAEKAEEIKNALIKINIDAVVIKPTVSADIYECPDYLRTLTVDISHKMIATRAGLGWIGKTDLFISEVLGPRLRLVSILINQKPDRESVPIEESRCGKCDICVRKCPAQAAKGILWNIQVHRDDFFDAYKCRGKCRELTKQRLNIDEQICGICVSVCPVGKKNRRFAPVND